MRNLNEILTSIGIRSKKKFIEKYTYKLDPFEDEVNIRAAFNLRRNAVRRFIEKLRPGTIDDYLMTVFESRQFEDEHFVYAKRKIHNMKFAKTKSELELMSEFYEKMCNKYDMPEVESCGYFSGKKTNYLLLETKPGTHFLTYALSQAIDKEDSKDFGDILFEFGSLCKTIVEKGYLYSLDLSHYTAKKESNKWNVLPCCFKMEKHNYKTKSNIFRNHYQEMKQHFEGEDDFFRNFKKGFYSH